MKFSYLFVVGGLLLLIGVASIAGRNIFFNKHQVRAEEQSNDRGFAVVELFTSEGCSSCPPADNLLASVEKEIQNKPVYILAYHVDYWDRLGWKDNFSAAAFTERQRSYADWLHLNSVYTPQIVVNGKKEFVGSNKNALNAAITSSLKDSSAIGLKVTNSISNDHIDVEYTVEGSIDNSNLVVNLVQKNGQSMVKRGENAGLKLTHVQIVRKQVIESLKTSNGKLLISLPDHYKDQQWELICFIQNKEDGVIRCAAKSSL